MCENEPTFQWKLWHRFVGRTQTEAPNNSPRSPPEKGPKFKGKSKIIWTNHQFSRDEPLVFSVVGRIGVEMERKHLTQIHSTLDAHDIEWSLNKVKNTIYVFHIFKNKTPTTQRKVSDFCFLVLVFWEFHSRPRNRNQLQETFQFSTSNLLEIDLDRLYMFHEIVRFKAIRGDGSLPFWRFFGCQKLGKVGLFFDETRGWSKRRCSSYSPYS